MKTQVKVEWSASWRQRAVQVFCATLLVLTSLVGISTPAQAGTGDNYPDNWKYATKDTVVDSWGYYNRNCTSWAAWALHDRNGFEMPWAKGNGAQWGVWARDNGYEVNDTPAVGAIAWWGAYTLDNNHNVQGFGHVAWVSAVNGTSVTIEEYNYLSKGIWGSRTITPSSTQQVKFIHFKDMAPGGSTASISGDNKADLIWYEAWNNGGQAKVIATNSSGNGTASGNVWFSGYAAPDWAGVGDFNGDSKTDLAWYEGWNNGTLKVLFSNGSGYSSSTTWFSGFGKPTWAGVGDFTGDGRDDIAWYEGWNNGGTMKVIPTNPSGTGPNTNITWFSGFSAPDWADVGDLTGDGKDDIAWYEGWNNGSLKVIATNSAGTGPASGNTWFSGYGAPTWAAIGNFSGDGKEDIAWYEDWNSGGKVTVLPSNGAGTNPGISWFSGYAKPDRAFAADFTGDGRDDIAWYEGWNNGTLKVIPTRTDGTGTGPSITWFSGYGAPTWAAAG